MKNYQKIAIIGANLRGMMCARSLIKQGLHVSIFDEMKGGSSRNLEDLLEYIPIICDNYKENPIFKLFNEGRTSYGSFLIDFDVCDKDYKFISDENLENSEKKFFELINEIFNTKEDENGNFHAKFNFLLEKDIKSNANDKRLVRWIFQKYQFFKRMIDPNMSIKEFKEKFTQGFFDKPMALAHLIGYRGLIASDLITNLKKCLSDEGVIFKYDKKIERIEKNSEGIYIYYRREKMFFDYLIYGHSPYFLNGVTQIMQKPDCDMKNSIKNRPPRDMINFSSEIFEELSFFKHLDYVKYKHILFILNFKIWNGRKSIISIFGNNDKEMLLLFDLSNYIERQYSVLFVYYSKNPANFDEKNLKDYLISILEKIFEPRKIKNADFIKDYLIIENFVYFLQGINPNMGIQECLQRLLNPSSKIFFNIPIFLGQHYDKLLINVANSSFITSKILHECYKVEDFDQETYENKIYGDYKIKSKKPSFSLEDSKTTIPAQNIEPLPVLDLSNIVQPPVFENVIDMVKKQDQNLSQVTSINSSSESNNLITIDAKDKCKNAKQPENITIASKRPFPFFTEILINPGMTQKKIKENHYFSKKPLIFDPFATDVEELFGLSHVLYLNNNDFVKTYIKNKDNDLSFLETLSLQNPYKICSHFYLNNIGQYYFTKKNKLQKLVPINNEDLKENEDFENLQFGNRFCTFRMYKSFLNTGLLVYYYQFKVYVKEIDLTFYVVLPEDGVADFHNRDLLLFHTNLNELMSALFLKIQEKQKGENSFRPFRFLQNKKCLFPTILPDIIYDKILKKYNNNSFDIERNLEETFKKFESEINSIEKISCDSLEPLINQFFESLLSKYDLPKMHLGDFFFGYNLPKIQALVKLVKRNKNFSLNRFPEDLKAVFCNLSPYLKLKQKLAFSDLQDNKIPLPYKCLRLFLDLNDPSKEIWYYLEISKKKNINLRKLNEENSSAYKTTNRVIKKKGKGTLTFQICKLEEKMKKTKKDCKIRANSYDCWGIIIEKIKDSPNFYLNQRFFFDYLQDYIAKELKYYRKFEKIVKIVNNLEIQRKIERTPEELKLVQQEIEEVFSIDQKRELNNIFCQDDTFEVVDNQNIIHTYELN